MNSQKGWGKKGEKGYPYDKGKGKGYGSSEPWSQYTHFQSKGKGKSKWGNEKGYTKGGKGTYMMEHEGTTYMMVPHASYPDQSWHETWKEQGQEDQPC